MGIETEITGKIRKISGRDFVSVAKIEAIHTTLYPSTVLSSASVALASFLFRVLGAIIISRTDSTQMYGAILGIYLLQKNVANCAF